MYHKTQCAGDREFIMRLSDLRLNKSEIARKMNVSEGTIDNVNTISHICRPALAWLSPMPR